jgi:hypothetical protein
MDLEKILNKIQNTDIKTWHMVLLVGVVVLILYYIMSPYQNCVRNLPEGRNPNLCTKETGW